MAGTDGTIRLPEIATPDTPPANNHRLYIGSDGNLKKVDDVGAIVDYDSGLVFTAEDAQDAVGAILTDTSNIDLNYNDGANEITADLVNTTVTPGSYGTASQVPTIAFDAKGRATSASNTAIAITASQVTDFTEAVQDAQGASFVDSASVDFTYSDVGNTVTADVLPAGVNHDALLNFVANKHVDHSGVQVATAATSGLQGGGDITATRNLSLDVNGLTVGERPSFNDQSVIYDSSLAAHRKISLLKSRTTAYTDYGQNRDSDFILETLGGLTSTVTGAGASNQAGTYGIDLTEKAYGVVQSDTGTTATGRASLTSASLVSLWTGQARLRFGVRFAPEALSVSGVEDFDLYVGFIDNTGAGDQTDGAYFRYNDAVNAGRWESVVAQGAVLQAVDTGVLATTNYQVFEVEFNEAGTSCAFYIDGALVATQTTNLPSGPTQAFGFGWSIKKTVGTTQRNASSDWYYFEFERSTAR